MPNPGNLGDGLISFATIHVFNKLGLSYEFYDSCKKYTSDYTLVYGGGGYMVPEWIDIEKMRNLFSAPKLQRCVILPHSIYGCHDVLELMDARFTIFTREMRSYNYVRQHSSGPDVYLVNDMAFYVECDLINRLTENENLNSCSLAESLFANLARCFRLMLRSLKFKSCVTCDCLANIYLLKRKTAPSLVKKMEEIVQRLDDGRCVAWFMREDKEKSLSFSLPDDIPSYDLSSLIPNALWAEPRFTELSVSLFFSAIQRVDVVISDRLHVSIAAAILGKQTIMLDNNYGKLFGVWQKSMQSSSNVRFCKNKEDYHEALNDILHLAPDA